MDTRNEKPNAGANVLERELVFTREFDAPRSLVFKAWTDPKRLARWWGPKGFTNPVCELDVRPGGVIRIDMRGPDGTLYPMAGAYQEVVEPERLVFTSAALDEKRKPLFEVLNTVTLAETDGRTTQVSTARIIESTDAAAPYVEGMEAGWIQTLNRLEEQLAKSR
jgi:uncharacterized protein YndB with AHSA1/START domain